MEIERKRIYLPLTISITLLLAGAALASASPDAQNSDKPGYVYLTWASNDTAHTINVSWKTEENYTGEVHYGTQSQDGDVNAYQNVVQGSGGVTTQELDGFYHHVELTDLEPDTKYYFVCGYDNGWSGEQTFKTTPSKPESLEFAVGGDSRSNKFFHATNLDWPEARNKITKLVASYNPDFICFGGDYLSSGQEQRGADTWDNWLGAWFNYARTDDGSLIPLVPTIGNHEITYPQPSVYEPSEDASNYYAVFNLPGNERWYSLDWNNFLHFTVLDSEIMYTGADSWKNQENWLENDINANKDDLWKFVSCHRPLYSTPGEHSGELGHLEDWTWAFDTYHVDMVFQSHNHGYERTGPINHNFNPENQASSPENGTIYVTAASWGAELYGNQRKYSWFTAENSPGRIGAPENAYHAVLVEVSNGTLDYKAIKHDGSVLDQMTIQKGPGKEPDTQIPVAEVAIGAIVILAIVVVIVVFYRK